MDVVISELTCVCVCVYKTYNLILVPTLFILFYVVSFLLVKCQSLAPCKEKRCTHLLFHICFDL